MKEPKEQEHLLNRLFEEQREQEIAQMPSFSKLYEKAQQKHQKMKKIRLTLLVAFALVVLAGLAILTTDKQQTGENVPIAAAGLNFYESLQNKGKFVVNNIQFAFNRADLKPESMSIIETIAEMMEAHPEVRLSVEGHTDAQGASNYNQELSAARAAAVRQALIDKGIASGRLKAVGFGESQPLADNNSDAGRAKNRRVEFVGF